MRSRYYRPLILCIVPKACLLKLFLYFEPVNLLPGVGKPFKPASFPTDPDADLPIGGAWPRHHFLLLVLLMLLQQLLLLWAKRTCARVKIRRCRESIIIQVQYRLA